MKNQIKQIIIRYCEKFKLRPHVVLIGVMTLFLLVSTFLVLPSFADETGDEPLTETVSEDEFEPTMTPDVTVRPFLTEAPDTPEPEETVTPEQEKHKEREDEFSEKEEEPSQTPSATMETFSGHKDDESESGKSTEEETKSERRMGRAAAPVQLQEPTCQTVEEPVGPFTYPLKTIAIKVKVQVTPPAGAGYECQWYVSRRAGENGEKLVGHGAQTPTYTLPVNTGAGTYYYYCVVKSVDNDGYNLDSKEVRSSDIVVSIDKGEPELEHFNLSAIKKEYYYTGEIIDPAIVCSQEGMGDAYIVVKDGNVENRPKAEREEAYPIFLHISEGSNYKAKTIDLNRTIRIRRLPTPTSPYSISGTKGKLVDGTQWYTSDVKITPKSGFLISANGIDFSDVLLYSENGTNQGPAKNVIYLQNKSNKAITDDIAVTQKINIDKIKPVASIKFNSFEYNSVEHDYNDMYDNGDIAFELAANDDVSGVANLYYYWAKDVLTERQLASTAWKSLSGETSLSMSSEGTSILYVKAEDKAGNIGFASSDRITIDRTKPEIVCGTKSLGETKSYFADRKKLTVKDTHLRKVTVRRDGTVELIKSGDDIVKGSTTFSLDRPDGRMEDVTYSITAEDAAGNEKTTNLTLKNPVLDVEADDLDFGSGDDALTYGYEKVEPKPVIMRNKADGQPVVADSLELELAEGKQSSFEIVDGTKVRPKQGLHVGTYTETVRIYYNGEAESTTVCRCTLDVKKANMLVSYTGQTDVGYHTLPDLTGTIEYAASDFKNGDTKKVFETDPNFQEPKLYYRDADYTMQEYTADKRAMETMQLIPDGGNSSDYIFSYKGGELEVRQHLLRNGYVIEGDKVEGYNWYVSENVAIRPAEGFRLSDSQDPGSFATANQLISVAGPTNGVEESFYVMNNTTGEISACMKETIKIDNTAPFFRKGEGIMVSSDLWAEFCNSISFGIFFNNTRAVAIRATDEESGLESIQYCVSPTVVSGNSQELEKELTWQEYEEGFSITPEEYERAVIYAKITNHAGLVTYISSNGLVFDNRQPDINKVENGKEQGIIDEKEYITEELTLRVSDNNLEEVTLYEGTSMAVSGSALAITEDEDHTRHAGRKIACPSKGSKTYTVIAKDYADNNTEREFTITKPIYDIVADTLEIHETDYGYGFVPQTPVTWKNTEKANADATVSKIELGNDKDFEVKQSGNDFWIAAKKGLAHGVYTTDVTLIYNGGKRAETTCSFQVNKATLTAVYTGGDCYYHEKAGGHSSVKVTGFVKQNGIVETPQTAAGYKAPTVEFDGVARETREFTPTGGKADNYKFDYQSGLLLVDRRYAKEGKDGQYTVEGEVSDTGWYTSDITIRPKEGFVFVREEEDQKPLDHIILTKETDDGEESFYVMNEVSGEIYYKTVFNYKRDTVRPAVHGITPDNTYEENSREVIVEDDNLFGVTVNGKSQDVEGSKARFYLTAEQETTVYVIVATDLAGNMNDMTVVLNQPGSLPVNVSGEENSLSTQNPSITPQPEATVKPDITQQNNNSKSVKKSVKIVKGAPDASLTSGASKLKTSVLTSGEQKAVDNGSNATVELRIRSIDSQVPQADKELVIANLGSYTLARYFNITLWKKVGNSPEKKVSKVKNPIAITLSIPEELRNASREYVFIHVHGKSASVLKDLDSSTNTITVETDRFSTYALAYRENKSGAKKKVASAGSDQKEYTDGVDGSPEMGDDVPFVPVSLIFFAALAGIIMTMVVRRKQRSGGNS